MNRHLTEKELIEYRFRLASDEQAGASAEHVAGCAECRERLEQLDRKFAALDLLREDVHASEELIAQVMEQTKGVAKAKVVPFFTLRWIGAAAAVLVIGFVLFIGGLPELNQARFAGEKSEVADSARRSQPLVESVESPGRSMPPSEPQADSRGRMLAKETGAKMKGATAVDSESERVETETYASDASGGMRAISGSLQPMKPTGIAGDIGMESIVEPPPFAPASAIELVTLPRRDNVQLTIYNSADLTLVRERRNLTLKKGWNWLQFMWANTLIDPTSLSLEPLEQAGKIDIQQLVFPARLRELGRWLIRSEISGQVPFEITYFTSGLSWRAFYMGTLSQDEKTMHLSGYVRVANNSGEDYENAQTRLVVGQVHVLDQIADLARRQYPYDRPVGPIETGDEVLFTDKFINSAFTSKYGWKGEVTELNTLLTDLKPKEIKKEGLSEYFLYTIEGTETIPNEWGKRLLSFEVEDIAVESLYKYDEERWGNHTIRFVSFANDDEHNLGDTPIPNGMVRIYGNASDEGYLSYVGETYTKYLPVGEEVELNLGSARLVEIEPKLMDFKTDNYVFDNRGNISGWDEIRTWKIEMTNTRTLPIEIEITRGFGTTYWTLQSDTSYKKHDATHARFEVNLEPRSKRSLEYTVRTCHGAREETFSMRP
jgi:hypothetical protein